MTREEAKNYLKSSGMSEEQIETVINALTCDDCISREAVLEKVIIVPIAKVVTEDKVICRKVVFAEDVQKLSSVTPQPKMGRWLAKSFHEVYCDNCGFDFDIMRNEFTDKMKYCPNCGAKMAEGSERK